MFVPNILVNIESSANTVWWLGERVTCRTMLFWEAFNLLGAARTLCGGCASRCPSRCIFATKTAGVRGCVIAIATAVDIGVTTTVAIGVAISVLIGVRAALSIVGR